MKGATYRIYLVMFFVLGGCDYQIPDGAVIEEGAEPGVVEQGEPILESNRTLEALKVNARSEAVPFVPAPISPPVAMVGLPEEVPVDVGNNIKPACWNATITHFGDMTVASQEELDSLSNLSQITGNLVIDVDAFEHLSWECLEVVGGTIFIGNAEGCGFKGVMETASFPSLEWVGGVRVRFNTVLQHLSMPNLMTLNGDWEGFLNPLLETVDLGSLETLGGSFYMTMHDSIKTVDFSSLESVGGDIELDQVAMLELSFPSLASVIGGVFIWNGASLSSLDFPVLEKTKFLSFAYLGLIGVLSLPELVEVDALILKGNGSLYAFSFPQVTFLGGGLVLEHNSSLLFAEMPLLTHATNFSIFSNESLQEVSFPVLETVSLDLEIAGGPWPNLGQKQGNLHTIELPGLKTVGEDLLVEKNDSLQALTLPKLQSVGEDFRIDSNGEMSDINVGALKTIGGSYSITWNQSLTWMNPGNIEIGGNFIIADNFALTGFCGGITFVGGDFVIEWNPVFDFFALPALENIGGDLRIIANEAFESMMTPGLTTIEGGIEVTFNEVLNNIQISALASVGEGLEFNNNYAMSECFIEGLISQVENREGIGGEIEVYDNGEICE